MCLRATNLKRWHICPACILIFHVNTGNLLCQGVNANLFLWLFFHSFFSAKLMSRNWASDWSRDSTLLCQTPYSQEAEQQYSFILFCMMMQQNACQISSEWVWFQSCGTNTLVHGRVKNSLDAPFLFFFFCKQPHFLSLSAARWVCACEHFHVP